MANYSGRYRWDGIKKNNQEPIAWSPGAYDIEIFQCKSSTAKVHHLKSHVCLYARTGEGHSISANPEKFAKQICSDFALELERVLWVEDHLTETDRYEVIQFTRSRKVGKELFYKIDKRKPQGHELELIRRGRETLKR
ncbi:MAG: hypothetical protein ACN4GW_15970 [Desulforhopalus sp.]